ncbi:hypothetical protein BC829DRAFT_446931 [Chytridium lagenaria]|nr:hypothetical protein BC829DRAFT_446931 [Chytridium lagenaria]
MSLEVELKFRLSSLADLKRAQHAFIHSQSLSESNVTTTTQIDTFLDAPHRPIWSDTTSVFRIRRTPTKTVFTLKSGSIVKNGVMIATEHEIIVPESTALHLLQTLPDPSAYPSHPFLTPLSQNTAYQRKRVEKIELDHTKYDFGDAYEIELETKDVEGSRAKYSGRTRNKLWVEWKEQV